MTWVDYAQLRRDLDIVRVMTDAGVELHGSGDQRKAKCPFEDCRESDSRSFSVHVAKGLWKCWRCKATGNLIGFAARMQGLDPDDNRQFRKAALALQERYGVATEKAPSDQKRSPSERERRNSKEGPKRQRRRPTGEGGKPKADELVNEPLDFELKELDPEHEAVRSLVLKSETVAHFGLGYCGRRGMFHGCVAAPIHNAEGELIANVGLTVAKNDTTEAAPTYRFPDKERTRRRDNKTLVFDRTRVVYNAHRVEAPTEHLVVVDDIRHAWIVHDLEYPHVVAILGQPCQQQIDSLIDLVKDTGILWFLTDAGWPLKSMIQVARERAVRWIPTTGGHDLESNLQHVR